MPFLENQRALPALCPMYYLYIREDVCVYCAQKDCVLFELGSCKHKTKSCVFFKFLSMISHLSPGRAIDRTACGCMLYYHRIICSTCAKPAERFANPILIWRGCEEFAFLYVCVTVLIDVSQVFDSTIDFKKRPCSMLCRPPACDLSILPLKSIHLQHVQEVCAVRAVCSQAFRPLHID